MQIITVSGRIGQDAEVRQAGQSEVASFNLAVDQGWGDKKQTNWFRINLWGKKGVNSAPYMLKGGVVTVVGELDIGEYNGKPQYSIRASDFTMPAKQGSGQRQQENRPGGSSPDYGYQKQADRSPTSFDNDLDDEVPF